MTREEVIAILESYKKVEDNRTETLLHYGCDNTKEATKRKEALDLAGFLFILFCELFAIDILLLSLLITSLNS